MTHSNHDWDTTKTPAIPESVGDRYYAQDLNDDFNYLKHLSYEIFLQKRKRGVMIAPDDTWNDNSNSLTLSGGYGAIMQDCIELDPDEDFVIPPKTHSSSRYERVLFTDTTLILPNDGAVHWIVANPTKRSLLQRTKAIFTEQYASRVRYDGVITIQDTYPTAGQILVGLCHDKEYCLLIDNNPDQRKDNIILKKWFGQNKITQDFIPALQNYYSTTIASIETKISIDTMNDGYGIYSGTFNNCAISIDNINSSIVGGAFNNCTISIDRINNGSIYYSIFNNCTISINRINSGVGIYDNTFNNCTVSVEYTDDGNIVGSSIFNKCIISRNSIDYIEETGDINAGNFNDCIISINELSTPRGINGGNFNNCIISIGIIDQIDGISGGFFINCTISIDTISKNRGINGGNFNNCIISIGTSTTEGIRNSATVTLYFTRISCLAITDLSSTRGKLNILNDTIFKAG